MLNWEMPTKKCYYLRKPASSLWQYGLLSFQTGVTELKIFFPKNQHIQRKLLNFEFWIIGEQAETGHQGTVWWSLYEMLLISRSDGPQKGLADADLTHLKSY